MVYNYDNWLVWGGFFTFILLFVFTTSNGYSPADGIMAFFSPFDSPRKFVTYLLVATVPLFFFKYARGSLLVFVAFFILACAHIASS